jgi:hypothetical protein
MVYYRSWWHFYVCGFLRGAFQNQYQQRRNLHRVAQGATDGAIARHYTVSDWRCTVEPLFTVESAQIYGLKPQIIPLPYGRPKVLLERLIPNGLARLLTNQLRMGSFLVAHMRRNEVTGAVTRPVAA